MNLAFKIAPWFFLAGACLALLPLALADEVKGGYNRPLLEHQQKFTVPASLADSLWQHIRRRYQPAALKKINPHYATETSQETYVDAYYDDASRTLLRHQHSLRLRRLFSGKDVALALLQLKINPQPPSGLLRQEIKINLNDRPDKDARDPDHPFWQLIRSADRPQVDSLLGRLGVESRSLAPVLTLHQVRRRLYLRERGEELAYISLDQVRTEAGESGFYELELALNEATFTRAPAAQRQRLTRLLEWLQLDLTQRFPALRQDQTPKYNRMYQLLHQQRPRPRQYNYAWLVIAVLVGGIGLYLFYTRHQPVPRSPGLF